MARILAIGNQHLSNFNSSRCTRHQIIWGQAFANSIARKVCGRIFGYGPCKGLWFPGNTGDFDIIHAFNSLPVTTKNWIVTFEDILPRTFGGGRTSFALKKIARRRLALENCRKLIALSKYAVKKFMVTNQGWKELPAVLEKTIVIPPNLKLKVEKPKRKLHDPLRLIFIGRHFARKGGVSAVRLAKKASEDGFPLEMHIVSKLRLGAYTDHANNARYDEDLRLLNLPNVIFHSELPNTKVQELLKYCDVQFMPTLGDTYGYSILEGFAVGTSAITTRTCALPEFVRHGENGFLLDVEVDQNNDIAWLRPAHDVRYRETDAYWLELDRSYSELAERGYELLVEMLRRKGAYEALSEGAIMQIKNEHDAMKTARVLDSLYDMCLT